MNKLILAASALALIPAAAQAQLLGGGLGGGLGGSLGGTLDTAARGSISPEIERTTRTVRGTVDGTASTRGSQSVDARRGTVQAERSAEGSLTGTTASLSNLVVPSLGDMAQGSGSGSGSASGSGNANAQLIGTDTLAGSLVPVAGQAQSLGGNVAGTAAGTQSGIIGNAPLAGLPAMPMMGDASGEGGGLAMLDGAAALARPALAVAGTAAATGEGAATVTPGMPVTTPDGASLGTVREVIANGRGEVQQVVVQQGGVTRELPAGIFSASGNALIVGQAQGNAQASSADTAPTRGAVSE